MDYIPITEEGLSKLKEELERLKTVERPKIIKAIEEARAQGDLSENADYHAAREKHSFIEGKIQELEDKIARAKVIDKSQIRSDKVVFGATVRVRDEENGKELTYTIVGEEEVDISKNRISVKSPIARALINKGVGEQGEVVTPKGERYLTILEIRFD
ncbi:MAG: transcription elongation factor GreA [Deltaproteobacteria bacterium]|nr:transcription elongation factor GreA [Deltaproteobacteria bacterium]